jgi:pimeloyl-ACP methyl ester carboxylesterase
MYRDLIPLLAQRFHVVAVTPSTRRCSRAPVRDDIQDILGNDYYTNVLLYRTWQTWLRDRQPRTLIIWGKGDRIFGRNSAEAYRRDLPHAKLVFYEGGHFMLEEYAPEAAEEITRMFSATAK